MKLILQILTLSIAVGAISCSGPTDIAIREGVTIRDYVALTKFAKPISFPDVVTLSLSEPGQPSKTLPPVRIKLNKRFTIADQREFIYPSAYDPAEGSLSGHAVTPVKPIGFRSTDVGFIAELTATRKGSLIVIEGLITVREFAGFSNMSGQLGQPILNDQGITIAENRIEMPKFATYTTPIQASILPEGSSEFEISHPTEGAKVVIALSQKE